jgi:hypothetical protein
VNTQELLDWAIAQDCPVPTKKLMLIALAYSAGPEGGGKIALDRLARIVGTKERACRNHLKRLALSGLVVYELADNVVTYGLSVKDRAS